MPALSEEDIQSLFMWIDEIPLSRPKKNLSRDFSDGVLAAEVVNHFIPKLVHLHNYAPANSISQKIYNWSTLNVFRKLGYCINDPIINAIVNCRPGYVEYLLFELRQRIEEYLIHKPAMPKIYGKKHKSTRSEQNSDKSTRSDKSSENEHLAQSQVLDPPVDRYLHDANEYQKTFSNGKFIQQDSDGVYQNAPSQSMTSPNMAYGGFTMQSPKSGYSPYTNISPKMPQSQTSLASPKNVKPRVVIKEPVPYYKTPKTAHDQSMPASAPDYGKEIAETLRVRSIPSDKMMQLKMERLETLIELKDKKIEELTKQINTMS